MKNISSKISSLAKGILCTLLVAGIATAPLSAQDVDAAGKWRFGFQAGGALPLGDGSDWLALGFGGDLVVEYNFNENIAFRARAPYFIFDSDDWRNVELDVFGLMFDGVYRFDKHSKGPYVLASLGYLNNSIKVNYTILDLTYKTDTSEGSLAFGAGFGWNFNRNFYAEARYTYNSPDYGDFGFASLSAGFRY